MVSSEATPRVDGLLERLAAMAAATPFAPAISDGATTLDYRSFVSRVLLRAAALSARGIGAGARVGLLLPRGYESIVTAFACWTIGAAFVSLDPDLPMARLDFMIHDAALAVVVGHREKHASAVLLEELDATPDQSVVPVLASNDSVDLLAYIVYTSGSTGTPKGVAVAHRTLRYFVDAFDEVLDHPGCRAVWIAGAPLSFDMCVPEVIGALTSGAHVVVRRRLEALAPLVERHRGTHLQCTPSQLALFAAYPTERAALAKLDHLIVAGETLPIPLAVDVRKLLKGRFTNAYGPTEITVYAFSHEIDRPPDGPVPIGRPFPGTDYWVVDERLQPVAAHTMGQLVIGGSGVALGYYGRSDLTDASFAMQPFGDAGSTVRVYLTGDLVQEAQDGTIEFHGRVDHQVKVRGFRIELGEIEAVLMQDPDVLLAAVVPVEHSANDVRLHAYVCAREGRVILVDALRERCRVALPWYMTPAAIELLSALPRMPTGKVDRVALAARPAAAASPTVSTETAAGHPIDAMCRIWEEVLRCQVRADDDFFALGGHSLIGIELLVRVGAHFGRRLPLGTLVEARTPLQLLSFVEADARAFRCLVALRSGSGPATVLVHGAGGYLLRLHALAQALSPGRPVFGLQATGLDGSAAPDFSVEDMARRYLGELALEGIEIGAFVGYSGGGLVVYEMARQQQQHGLLATPLVMIDADVPTGRAPSRADHWANFAVNVARRGPRIVHTWWSVRRSRRVEEERRVRVRQEVADNGFVDIQDHLESVMGAYVPRRLAGAVGLVMASDVRPTERPDYDWERLVDGRFVSAVCTGDHFSMLEPPDVTVLASTIDALIDRLSA